MKMRPAFSTRHKLWPGGIGITENMSRTQQDANSHPFCPEPFPAAPSILR